MSFRLLTFPEALEQVLCIPTIFRLRAKNCSLLSLVEETGFCRFRGQITVQALQDAIRDRAGLIETWLTYSREKPENFGWFIEGPEAGYFLVGSRKYTIEGPRLIKDATAACALFIVAELDAIVGTAHPPQTISPNPTDSSADNR